MTNTATRTVTPLARDLRDPNSTEVLTEQITKGLPGTARTAAHLLRLPFPLRTVARQERTFRLNTEPGWRPSDLMGRIVDNLLAGITPTSPVARAMMADPNA